MGGGVVLDHPAQLLQLRQRRCGLALGKHLPLPSPFSRSRPVSLALPDDAMFVEIASRGTTS
jgi:hypothetical protein